MSPEAERLRERRRRRLESAEERRARAQEFARSLARDLGRADPALRAVIGFGSTFETWRAYRMDSDLDLAVEGGDWGALWSMIPPGEFAVDLVELDLQPAAFAEGLRANGVTLYER